MKQFLTRLKPFWGTIAIVSAALAVIAFILILPLHAGSASASAEEVEPAPRPSASADPEGDAAAPPELAPQPSPSDPVSAETKPPVKPVKPETPVPSGPLGFTGHAYNGAVPESEPVDDDWFSDAAFLGDSRTDGFRLYSGLTSSHIYGEKCISVFNAFTEDTIRLDNGSYGTLLDAVALGQFAKVYIMLGVNELGYKAEEFGKKYAELAGRVSELQPDADIYIQAIIPVTQSRSDSDSIYNNVRIQAFNEQLAALCEAGGYYYVDTYSALADGSGALPEEASWDGVHLNRDWCVQWLDYLKAHTATE